MFAMSKLIVALVALLFVQAASVAPAPLDGVQALGSRFALAVRASSDDSELHLSLARPDTATSRPNRALFPGTSVPSDVMTHLLSERFRVENHINMGIVDGYEATVLHKLHEMLLDPKTPVSSMTHDGQKYFITRFDPMPRSQYPEWQQMVLPTTRIEREAIYPIFIGKIQPNVGHGRNIELLAIRSPATVADRVNFVNSMRSSRNLVHFTRLL